VPEGNFFCTFYLNHPVKIIKLLSTILLLVLMACKVTYLPNRFETQNIKITEGGQLDSTSDIAEFLKPYRDSLSVQMNQVAGYLPQTLNKQGYESELGTTLCYSLYAYWNKVHGDSKLPVLAIYNTGGLRLPALPAGQLTIGKVYELLPFDNTLVALELDAETLKKWIKLMIQAGGWPEYGLKYTLQDTTLQTLRMYQHGKWAALDTHQKFIVLTNDYVANGGDQCSFLVNQPRIDLKSTPVIIRDLFLKYVQDLDTIRVVTESSL
jgi:2',3'-cyclic-nucleotide 2'-phosphodiesterase (5'-nucleotidase family)